MSKSVWTINGRFASQRMTGVQRYAYEIVVAMDALLRDQKVFADHLGLELTLPPKATNVPELQQMTTRSTSVMSGHAWDQLILPLVQRSGVLSLGNFGPIFARRHIVCIHDANTFIQPDSYSRTFQLAYRSLLPLIGKYASRVATVSQFSADMLVKYQVCRPEQIFVAPNGHEHALRWDASKSALTLRQNLKRPYILLLGSKAKHKNVEIVLRQATELDAAGVDIVVVGAGANIFGTDVPDIQSPNIQYAGFVGDDELAALYEGALCLTFPSRTEGFGIPPLEAMTRGCPVIAANVAALVEVGGDAVLYADPDHAGQWRDAILALLGNAELRASLIARGRKRAGLFSWKRSAEIYLDEIMKLETRNP